MQVFSKCTQCYEELTEEEIEFSTLTENENYPVCDKCLNKFGLKILNALKASSKE